MNLFAPTQNIYFISTQLNPLLYLYCLSEKCLGTCSSNFVFLLQTGFQLCSSCIHLYLTPFYPLHVQTCRLCKVLFQTLFSYFPDSSVLSPLSSYHEIYFCFLTSFIRIKRIISLILEYRCFTLWYFVSSLFGERVYSLIGIMILCFEIRIKELSRSF